VGAYLTPDPTGIVMGYVDPVYYPLMERRPLTSFKLADEGKEDFFWGYMSMD